MMGTFCGAAFSFNSTGVVRATGLVINSVDVVVVGAAGTTSASCCFLTKEDDRTIVVLLARIGTSRPRLV